MRLNRVVFISLLLFFAVHICYGQRSNNRKFDIEKCDSLLIGMKLKTAIHRLNLDTNWSIIYEPFGILRGIRSNSENLMVQLIVKRKCVLMQAAYTGFDGRYKAVKNMRIIGVSWMANNKCGSAGDVIPQYAFDRDGPCE